MKPHKGPHAMSRKAARVAVVQALYQMDIGEDSGKSVIRQFLDHRFMAEDDIDRDLFEDSVLGVIKYQDDIDGLVKSNLSKKWSLARLDLTLRAILRAACYEILRRPDVPALVIIDQYVTITGEFFDEKEPGFVNGILDNIAKSVRQAEFGLTGTTGHE